MRYGWAWIVCGAWGVTVHRACACRFVYHMNKFAADVGAANTVLRNPHGLTHPQQHSTAKCVAPPLPVNSGAFAHAGCACVPLAGT